MGTRTFEYNPGTLELNSVSITQNASFSGSGLYSRTVTRKYDTYGRSAGFFMGTDYDVTYGYENVTGRFKNASYNIAGLQKTATYYYVPESDLIERVETGSGMTNDIVMTYMYEPERNLKTLVKNEFPGIANSLISQYEYTYDDIGRRTDVKNTGTAFSQDAFSKYDYNSRSELTGSHRYLGTDTGNTAMPVDPETRIYTYDNIGNRETATEHTLADTYNTNELNQYNRITSEGQTESPAYDDDGNMTAYSGMKYTYNAENRLIAAEPESPATGDKKVEFVYDYMGRRVKKTVSVRNGSLWTSETEKLFIYDAWNMICEITIPDGQPAAEKYFVWGLDLSQSVQGAGGIGGLLTTLDKTSSDVYYYLYDANGNVGQLVSADGSIAAHYEYDPYGNIIHKYGPEAGSNVYRFSTKFYDFETGLCYYGFRYYSSELGKWLNRDPVEEKGGTNLYIFVDNNPLDLYDVLGLMVGSPKHGDPISPSKSAELIKEAQREADEALDKRIQKVSSGFKKIGLSTFRNIVRLKYIAFKKIGTDEGNRFVFTCKYGWLDHGHFFKNSYGTYESYRWFTALLAEFVEIGQTVIFSESAYSPEDKISNLLGREFATRMKKHDYHIIRRYKFGRNRGIAPASKFFDISQEWVALLKDAGSVKWDTGITMKGKTVEEWIKADLERWKNRKNTDISPVKAYKAGGSDNYKESQPIWKCLCDSDKPKRQELRY